MSCHDVKNNFLLTYNLVRTNFRTSVQHKSFDFNLRNIFSLKFKSDETKPLSQIVFFLPTELFSQ